MSRRTPDFNKILARMKKAMESIDEKIEKATGIKKLLEKALKTPETKSKIVLKASLSTNLFMIENTLESLEAAKEQLRKQAFQILGMAKLAKAQAKAKKKSEPN